MQSANITPAEKLLRRLEKTEDFTTTYTVTVEKMESHTCLYLRFSPAEHAVCLNKPAERQGRL